MQNKQNMNTEQLIEQIHTVNAQRRKEEYHRTRRIVWRIAISTAAAAVAAVLLIVLMPHGNTVQAATSTGIYCNTQCNPDDVIALIDNNINHIRTIQSL
jgi:anti-sigma-K factor RskA